MADLAGRMIGAAQADVKTLEEIEADPNAMTQAVIVIVIAGVSSVDESAITGESAPVIRESGGDRSSVTGGTRVLSDWLIVRITANPGESFLDRMIHLVEGANRQKTPNEIALTILLAVLTIVFLPVVVALQPFGHFSGAAVSVVILVSLLFGVYLYAVDLILSAINAAIFQWAGS